MRVDALDQMVNLVQSRTDNECTSCPVWFIMPTYDHGKVKGFWFSREAAEAHLKAYAYRYPKKAYVYCASAIHSDVAELYRLCDERCEK